MSVSIRVDPTSLKLSIAAFNGVLATFKANGRGGMEAAAQILYLHTLLNVSATDHTPAQLERLDFPYARRHLAPRVIHGPQPTIRDSRHLVHRRSGSLAGSLMVRAKPTKADISFDVLFNQGRADHIRHVLEGTKKMLPRNPIHETAMAPLVQSEMRAAVLAELRRTFGRGKKK